MMSTYTPATINMIKILVLLVFVPTCFGDMKVSCADGDEVVVGSRQNMTSQALLRYHLTYTKTNLTIVPLQYDKSIFDYCNLNLYTPAGIEPLLSHLGIKTENNQGWAAFLDQYNINCPGASLNTLESLYWSNLLVKYVQGAGGSFFLVTSANPLPASPLIHMRFSTNEDLGIIEGVTINIEGGTITVADGTWLKQMLLPTASGATGISCTVDYSTPDPNSLVNVRNRFSAYRVVSAVLFVLGVILSGISFRLLYLTRRIRGSSAAKNRRVKLLVLVPEAVNSIVRIVGLVDPLGGLGMNLHIVGRCIFTVQLPLALFTNFALLLVWMDALLGIDASLKSRFRKPVFATNPYIQRTLFTLFGILIVADVAGSISGYYGLLGAYATNLPAFLYIVCLLFLNIFSIKAAIQFRSSSTRIAVEIVSISVREGRGSLSASSQKNPQSNNSNHNNAVAQPVKVGGTALSKSTSGGVKSKRASSVSVREGTTSTHMSSPSIPLDGILSHIKVKVSKCGRFIILNSVCLLIMIVFAADIGVTRNMYSSEFSLTFVLMSVYGLLLITSYGTVAVISSL